MTRVAAAMASLLLATAGPAGEEELRPAAVVEALIEAAPEGATIRVEPGRYAGPLRVRKGVILEGQGRVTIDGGEVGTVVELLVPVVTFRGFNVRGSGAGVDGEPAGIRAEAGPVVIEDNRLEDVLFGIDLQTSSESAVRRNTVVGKPLEPGRRGDGIRLWWSHECIVEDNDVRESRDMVFWYSEGLQVRRNRVRDCRYGLHFMYSHDTTLAGNRLEGNSVGVYLMYSNRIAVAGNTLTRNRGPSGYGLGLKDCDDIVVRGNSIAANRVGLYVDNAPSSVDSTGVVEGNFIAFNEMGMLVTPNTRRNIIAGNGFIENEEQVAVHGRGDLSGNTFSTEERGNFWSDYAGFDRDGDGVGDLPYEARSLFENLLAREPSLRLFVHSPAQQAIEFTARAVPEVRPVPKYTDPFPLMAPPEVPTTGEGAGSRVAMAGASLALTATGLLALAAAARRPAGGHRGRTFAGRGVSS